MRKIKRKAKRKNKFKDTKTNKIDTLLNTAKKHQQFFNLDLAEQTYGKCIKLNPKNLGVLSEFGQFLFNYRKDYKRAQFYIEEVARCSSQEPVYFENLANFYIQTNQWDLLKEICERYVETISQNYLPFYYMGQALRVQKQYDKAADFLDRALEISPIETKVHLELCSLYDEIGWKDKLIQQLGKLERILGNKNDIQVVINANFILGKFYDSLNDYKTAFKHLIIANDLRGSQCKYSYGKQFDYIQRIKSVCDTSYLDRHTGLGYTDKDIIPIFVVGMPRSGTSLIEQVLSMHPQVTSAGELSDFYNLSTKFTFVEPEHYYFHGKEYVSILKNINDSATKYVTDKMPDNYLYVGLIKLALPNAIVIHCKRNPMDTCFSCYEQAFPVEMSYSFDLKNLGKHYLLYQEFMEHWHKVMPGFIYDISYEEVVENFETEMKNLFAFCDLQWKSSYTQFYNSTRRAGTASRDQVIKPIYNSSIGRWKKYRRYLQPLSDILLTAEG